MQYQDNKDRFGRKIKWGIGLIVLTAIVIGGFLDTSILEYKQAEAEKFPEIEQPTTEATREKLEKKIEQMTNEILDEVKKGESHGANITAGQLFYTNDPHSTVKEACSRIGGKRKIDCDSWGLYQFKIPTVIHYSKTLHNQDLSETEAMLIALDPVKSRSLARDIIIKVEGGVWEWSSATKNQAYFERTIPLIRELQALL